MVAKMTSEKERLHQSRFPDSEDSAEFELPVNVESALLRNIVYQENFSEFNRKSQAFKLTLPPARTRQSLPEPGEEDRMILVESFASHGRLGMGLA